MKRILLTGSSGFIGKMLSARIENRYELMHLESDLVNFIDVQKEVEKKIPI